MNKHVCPSRGASGRSERGGGGDKEALLQKSGQGDCDFEVCIKIKRLLFEGLTPKVQNSRST